MIVRTYGRRNRGVARSYSDPSFNDDVSDGGFGDSSSQDSPQDVYNFTFSSQDSSAHWSFSSDPYDPLRYDSLHDSRELAILPPRMPLVADDLGGGDGVILKSKKPRNLKRKENGPGAMKMKSKEWRSDYVGPTTPPLAAMTTLMETQEFGEMMEHVDEVNFALDGLRKAQPVRIRRASLLTLLSICVTAQQRRLLRTHGMAKIIVDTILGLSFDDSPSNVAAATLFYVLTCDGQDDQLLDSPSCICFLIKLLKPHSPDATKNEAPIFGTKLLSLRKDADTFQVASKGMDSATAAILHKVQEILVNRKEMKPINEMEKLKLNAKWIAMLIMEKSCLSTISIEDTSGTVHKTGGNFKEKLREVGGLDAVFEVARICHSTMEGWLEQSSYSILESKDKLGLESLVLLLKCLKIMENATFQSRDNQIHLLEMKGNLTRDCFPKTFTKLILSVIRILSDVSLQKRSSLGCSGNENFCSTSNKSGHTSSLPLLAADKVDTDDVSLDALINGSIMGSISSQMSFDAIQSSQYSSAVRSGFSKSDFKTPGVSLSDTLLLKMRVDSSRCGSCSGTSNGSDNGFLTNKQGSRMKLGSGNRPKYYEDNKLELLEDSLDPFTFDEDEFEPSKWDLLSGRDKVSAQIGRMATKEPEGRCQSLIILSQQDSSSNEIHHSPESCCSSVDDEEKTNLLTDCLLTAVKVLMNLTNDNPEGCRQIASCGGLETLSSLIAGHFPSFLSYFPTFRELKENNFPSTSSVKTDDHKDRGLTDQELDFLVAILGLLVNLVEKDGNNRSRLAAANVSFPDSKGLIKDNEKHVIPLLCSIFLANQGAGEAAGEGKLFDLDDEDALIQGEKEAEMMIVEAYAALLLAFLSTESTIIRSAIAECLPDHNLAILVPVLERFVDFHLTLNMISPETHKVVREVIESCRIR